MFHFFLGLGSNLGEKQAYIEQAYMEITKRIGKIVAQSALYRSAPVDFDSANEFVNSVCEVETRLGAYEVLSITQDIERKLGRTSKSQNGIHTDRVIDIDILLFENQIINSKQLVVPHPKMHERAFVLAPFAEISPDTCHPVLEKTIAELLQELTLQTTK